MNEFTDGQTEMQHCDNIGNELFIFKSGRLITKDLHTRKFSSKVINYFKFFMFLNFYVFNFYSFHYIKKI